MQKGEVMTDRELLELAAKAAGINLQWMGGPVGNYNWNPLFDDGDALRLANRLGLSITHTTCEDDAPIVRVGYDCTPNYIQLPAFPDCDDATRRAIVRAAAEIGEAMP